MEAKEQQKPWSVRRVAAHLLLGGLALGGGVVALGGLYPLAGWLVIGLGLALFAPLWRHRDSLAVVTPTDEVRKYASMLFQKVPAGIFLLDPSDRVLFANEQAVRLFGRKAEELQGSLLDSMADAKSNETNPGLVPARRFRRADGTLFFAHVSEAPVEVAGQLDARRLRILLVSDITSLVEMHQRMQTEARLRTAASMATQFAHEVRNPVAAISGSAQVLEKLQRRAGPADPRHTVSDSDRALLYECIVSESDRLDGIVSKFLAMSEISDERLQQVLQLPDSTFLEKTH